MSANPFPPFYIGPWSHLRHGECESKAHGCHALIADVRRWWHAALKHVTSAIDEVYAVVDGREVRVAMVHAHGMIARFIEGGIPESSIRNLLEAADEQGYWERTHEVRLDLSPRPVSYDEVARAVLVGQEALERGGVVRS